MNIIDKRASNPAAALDGTELVYLGQGGDDAVTTMDEIKSFVSVASTTDTVTEGSTNLYFTDARVRNTLLTGLSLATNAAISAADSVLGALGKLQKQVTDILTNQRYRFVTDANTTYTVPASAITPNGNTIIELSNNSLTSITVNAATATGKTAGDSVTVHITGTYAAQLLVASGVTLNGTLAFSANAKIKTLIYRGSNTWTVLGGCPPVVYDTVLWLKFEGENGSTAFTDSSAYNAAFTRVGNPTIQDNSGAFFSGDHIKADQPVAGLYEWGDEDFEISGEFKLASIGGYQGIVGQRAMGGGLFTMSVYVDADFGNKLLFQVANSSGGYTRIIHQTAPSLNVLHSFKALRKGAYTELYLDDVKNDDDTGAFIGTEAISSGITEIHVGTLGTVNTSPLNGYVKELKITRVVI